MSFVIGYVEDKFKSQHAEDLEQLKEKCGETTAVVITEWFGRRYWNKFINERPEEEQQQIDVVAKVRIEELKQQYLLAK